jgi:hypothetical protein
MRSNWLSASWSSHAPGSSGVPAATRASSATSNLDTPHDEHSQHHPEAVLSPPRSWCVAPNWCAAEERRGSGRVSLAGNKK